MIDLKKQIRHFDDLTEEEKGLLKIVLVFPSFLVTLVFLLMPLLFYFFEDMITGK
jgi:hypothetical protein